MLQLRSCAIDSSDILSPYPLVQTYIWVWAWRWRWRRCWGWCWRRSRWTSPHGQPWTLSRSGGWTWSGPDNVASSASNGLSDLRGPEAVSAWIISLPRYHFHLTECLKENRLGQATLSGLCLTCPSSVTRSSLYLEARLWLLRSQVTRGLGLPVTEKKHFLSHFVWVMARPCSGVWLRPCKSIFMFAHSRLLLEEVWADRRDNK